MLWVEAGNGHRRLEVEAQPFLNANRLQLRTAPRQIEEQHQVEHNRSRQNGIATKKIDLDLHRIAQPSENVDVVPTFFVITARRVIVDADLMGEFAVQLGIELGLKDVFKYGKLRLLFGLERPRIIQHFAVTI